jgi:hypothetical protein
VSYSKQVLPKFIGELPNEDNSPSFVLSPKMSESSLPDLKEVKDAKNRPGLVSPPPGSPFSNRRSIFGLRGSTGSGSAAEKTRPSPVASQTSASHNLIGASLEELALAGRSSVPILLNECFCWIRSSGALDRNGLFRGTGDTDRIERIVNTFEQQPREPHRVLDKIDPSDDDVCSVVKL